MSEIKLLKCIEQKLCEIADTLATPATPEVRRDVEVLCDVTDPAAPVPVFVLYQYNTDGSGQAISAINLDGTAYAGIIDDLRACEAEQARFDAEEQSFCVNGAGRIRIRVYDAEVNTGIHVTEVWQDLLGVAVAAPTGADTVSLGTCPIAVLYPYTYESCATITATSEETTVRVFETRDAAGVVINRRIEDETGADVTGTVTLSACASCCVEHCIQVNLFDQDSGLIVPGTTETFELRIDGVLQTTVVHDYSTTDDGINKSSWYLPVVAAVNALPDWSMTLVSDIALPAGGKPTYRIEYTGTGAQTLRIDKLNSVDFTEYVADGSGNMTGNWSWAPDSTPFSDC